MLQVNNRSSSFSLRKLFGKTIGASGNISPGSVLDAFFANFHAKRVRIPENYNCQFRQLIFFFKELVISFLGEVSFR